MATGAASWDDVGEKLCSAPLLSWLRSLDSGERLINNDAHLPFCAAFGIGLFLLSVRRHGPELKAYPDLQTRVPLFILSICSCRAVYGVCGGTNPSMYWETMLTGMLYLFSLGGSLIVAAVVVPSV